MNEKAPDYEYIHSNPKIYSQVVEEAIEALAGEGNSEGVTPEMGDELWHQAREVSDAALIRGGATWETANQVIEFDNGNSVVSSHPSLRVTDSQIEAIRENEMNADLAEDKEVEVSTPNVEVKADLPRKNLGGIGYQPTLMEKFRQLFK